MYHQNKVKQFSLENGNFLKKIKKKLKKIKKKIKKN